MRCVCVCLPLLCLLRLAFVYGCAARCSLSSARTYLRYAPSGSVAEVGDSGRIPSKTYRVAGSLHPDMYLGALAAATLPMWTL
jgi:hypothetical protein